MNNKSFIFYVIFFISVFVFLTTTTPINASQAEKKFKPAKAQLSSSSYYMIKKISSEFDGKVRSENYKIDLYLGSVDLNMFGKNPENFLKELLTKENLKWRKLLVKRTIYYVKIPELRAAGGKITVKAKHTPDCTWEFEVIYEYGLEALR